jgi:hypothetical protein
MPCDDLKSLKFTEPEAAMIEEGRRLGTFLANVAAAGFVVASLAACDSGPAADPREDEVRRAVSQVKTLIDSTATNAMAAMSLSSMAEQGGTITTFIAASLPERATFTCFHEGTKPKAWCVLLRRGAAPNEYLIEGYGAALDKPMVQEKATATAARRH